MFPISRCLTCATVLFILAWVSLSVTAAEQLSYVDLVQRMTDLEHLAVLPAKGETCQQWSSYDRASRYDESTGKYVAWGANGDGQLGTGDNQDKNTPTPVTQP